MEQQMPQDQQTHFRLKLGNAEIEFTGDADFLKHEIMPAVSRIVAVAESTRPTFEVPKQVEHSTGDDIIPASSGGQIAASSVGSLASHIKQKKAEKSQVRRFLVTSDWLRLRGAKTIKAADVTEALRDNQQSKLANSADCLNQNVGKGYCEKTSDGFFITPEGLAALSESNA